MCARDTHTRSCAGQIQHNGIPPASNRANAPLYHRTPASTTFPLASHALAHCPPPAIWTHLAQEREIRGRQLLKRRGERLGEQTCRGDPASFSERVRTPSDTLDSHNSIPGAVLTSACVLRVRVRACACVRACVR
eukprot:1024739-Pleurochrysis_carterae.AAC.1